MSRKLWAVVALLALFSFLPVYSASSNLVYVVGNGTTAGHLFKHGLLLFLGLLCLLHFSCFHSNIYSELL